MTYEASNLIGRTVRLKIPMKGTAEIEYLKGMEFKVIGVAMHHLELVLKEDHVCPECGCKNGEIRAVRLVDVDVVDEFQMPEP